MLQTIFGKNEQQNIASTQFKMLTSYDNYFLPNAKDDYNDATIRTCIDTIARNAAKLQIHHIIRYDNQTKKADDALEQLLNHRPNEYMSSYDFLYKIVSMLYSDNNVFIKIKTDEKGNVIGLYPLSYLNFELREISGEVFVKFQFNQGTETIAYKDLIHLRRFFNNHDILGNDNTALSRPLRILNSVKQALENAVKNCMKLRGIIQINGIARPDDKQKILEDFNEKFTSATNGTGTAILDKSASYQQINSQIETANSEQMDFVRAEIYRYFGLNDDIIKSKFDATAWASFWENVLEPLAVQFSQEFTNKIFTDKEKALGNEIIFTEDKLQYASLQDKIKLVQALQPAGFISVNEGRELFGWCPVADGDTRMVSLNNVKAEDMSQYQLGKNQESGADE